MNVKLLRRVQKHILAEPKRLLMSEGIVKGAPDTDYDGSDKWGDDYDPTVIRMPACGTAGCIAGWSCLLGNPEFKKTRWIDVNNAAIGLLEIDTPDRLFRVGLWPTQFRDAYTKAKTPAGRARTTSRRIDHYISTKGAE